MSFVSQSGAKSQVWRRRPFAKGKKNYHLIWLTDLKTVSVCRVPVGHALKKRPNYRKEADGFG
jgi:hypothetical protein